MFYLLLLILPGVRSQVPTASSLLGPGSYQHHQYKPVQFVQPKSTKNGPILFPNDAPPPPAPPLIVTSRPLIESIARSELNPNNSLPAQSERYQVTYRPDYLGQDKSYRPFTYTLATVTPAYDYEPSQRSFGNNAIPVKSRKDNFYNDYEKRLMQSIHAKKQGTNRERTLWDEPIQRRKIDQRSHNDNARKTIFSDGADTLEIKVQHKSLYSRERNDDNEEDDYNVVFRRSNIRKNGKYSLKNRHYNTYRRNLRRVYSSEENVRIPETRPSYNFNNINANDDIDPKITITDDLNENYEKNLNTKPQYGSQNQNDNNNKGSKLKIQRRPLRNLGDLYEKSKVGHRKRSHNFNDISDKNDVPIKRRPRQNSEYLSDNNDRIPYVSSYHTAYKYDSDGEDKKYHTRHRINTHQRRPTHNIEYENILRKRPVYNVDSQSQSEDIEEMNQHSPVRPVYDYADRGIIDQKIPLKPPHFKYQQRFKTLKRKDRQLVGNANYYNTREDEHDASNEYNRGENYAFSYSVKDQKTGDDFSHSQQSTGSATNGEYRVRLPDGRMQIVSYTADENGYKADVKYDDQHDDNSIDVDNSKENRYRNDELSLPYKHNDAATYNNHFDSRDTSDGAYLNNYNTDHKTSYINEYSKPSTVQDHRQEFNNNNGYVNPNKFAHNTDYKDTTKFVDDVKSGDLTENNNDYLEHYNDKKFGSNDNVLRTHNDDYFPLTDELPLSKEIMDYSAELSQGYEPHKSKFAAFKTVQPSVRPSYEELRDLFVTNARGQNTPIPVVSTGAPHYDTTTENVVLIGQKKHNLYTNIRNIPVPVTLSPLAYSTPFAATPSGYLLSTIANLKNKVNLSNKPILSHAYINKINKYLSYK